eukprot:10760076-Lingulodinium_polyedra.AAC.1
MQQPPLQACETGTPGDRHISSGSSLCRPVVQPPLQACGTGPGDLPAPPPGTAGVALQCMHVGPACGAGEGGVAVAAKVCRKSGDSAKPEVAAPR